MIELSLGKWGQICHITWYPAVGKMGNRGGGRGLTLPFPKTLLNKTCYKGNNTSLSGSNNKTWAWGMPCNGKLHGNINEGEY